MRAKPITIGLLSFLLGAVIVVAVFAFADVNMALLAGPLLALSVVAYGLYRNAAETQRSA